MDKTLIGGLAVVLTLYVEYLYARAVVTNKISPHTFTWIIWGISTSTVFFALTSDNAGAGAWPIGIAAIACFVIAYLASRNRNKIKITQSDWIFFLAAIAAIPLWYITKTPLYTVIILTLIDLLGYFPTFRKSYHHPYSESLHLFGLMNINNLLVIAAIEHYSLITLMTPVTVACANSLLILFIMVRRKAS